MWNDLPVELLDSRFCNVSSMRQKHSVMSSRSSFSNCNLKMAGVVGNLRRLHYSEAALPHHLTRMGTSFGSRNCLFG